MDKVKPMDDHAEFVMSFVDDSREKREPFEDIWSETEQNWLVRPIGDMHLASDTRNPLATTRRDVEARDDWSVLKDPETHQAVMTIASKIVLGTMGEPGFIKATQVGGEDVFASSVVSKLLEYALRQEGHFWTFVEWVLYSCIYGVGIIEAGWHYEEAPRTLRSVGLLDGAEIATEETFIVPVYDDVRYKTVDVRDFFPDPGETMLSRMKGTAKRFKIPRSEAMKRAEDGFYRKAATERALAGGDGPKTDSAESRDHPGYETDGTHPKESHHDFGMVTGFEYFGHAPFKTADGIDWRVITVLNGETVRSKPWPRRMPFFDIQLTPRLGSFWGISPAEVIRYDQDFADVLKMMLADAVVRSTHPPHIYDRNAGVDQAKLRRFSPSVPIAADHVGAIQQVPYNPPVQGAFSMYAGTKQNMREGGGALGAIQGLGLGSKRFSATEAQGTFQQAMDRPELWGQIIEREKLPPLGKYTLELYQQFIEPGTDDLQRRIGQTAYPVVLADILADFDIEFVGSRIEGGKQQKLAAAREIFQASANPIVQQLVPWPILLRKWFEGIGEHEIAAMVGNPQMVQLNLALHQIAPPGQQAGNGNGTAPARQPLGALPAQLAGGPLGT